MHKKRPFTEKQAACLLALLIAISTAPKMPAEPVANSAISGKVVEDLTGNGVSTDDTPIADRVVRLYRDNGDKLFNVASDVLLKTDTTRRDGSYAFRNLPAGTYFVQQTLPAFWVQTTPPADDHDTIIQPEQA